MSFAKLASPAGRATIIKLMKWCWSLATLVSPRLLSSVQDCLAGDRWAFCPGADSDAPLHGAPLQASLNESFSCLFQLERHICTARPADNGKCCEMHCQLYLAYLGEAGQLGDSAAAPMTLAGGNGA